MGTRGSFNTDQSLLGFRIRQQLLCPNDVGTPLVVAILVAGKSMITRRTTVMMVRRVRSEGSSATA
jgi:hypothetical protein